MEDEEFEWDDEKAEINLRKHGISFVAARDVFEDVFALNRVDDDADEFRGVIIGMVSGVVLTVVYTERNDRTRIISARRATRHEQRQYDNRQTS